MICENSIVLSICIPTYNRINHVNEVVEELLRSKSSRFDIFILDNCSTNGERLKEFNDSRVHYILRDNPVDGRINLWDSLKYGDGLYRMFLIDRDWIISDKLEKFVDTLKSGLIRGGLCIFDKKDSIEEIKKYRKCEYPDIYGNLHPSGNFVRKDVVEEEYNKVHYMDEDSGYYLTPFMNDFLLANSMIKGDFLVYNCPLVVTAMTKSDKNEPKSNTYSPQKKNLYFMPESRMKQMNMDVNHINTFDLDKGSYFKYIKKLVYGTLIACTSGYKNIMENASLCDHYHLETRKVSKAEIHDIMNHFKTNFYGNKNIHISYKRKVALYNYAVFRQALSNGKRKLLGMMKKA